MKITRWIAMLAIAMLVLAGCQADEGSSAAASEDMASHDMSSMGAESMAPDESAAASDGGTGATGCDDATGDDLLAQVCEAGVILVSTDPNYAPQSFQNPDGSFEGFDIDVANEIGERLGLDVQFETPDFSAVTAGSWSGRWDMSVGSVTVTPERAEVLAFTEPYYYTPAQMAASEASGITDLEGLSGETVCVGADTTYLFWLDGTLELGEGGEIVTEAPEGVEATTLPTDQECAQAIQAGRTEFVGWLSSSTTVDAAIAEGIELVEVGDPVFFEPLAVAFDRGGADPTSMVEAVNAILDEMREDGTLTSLSEQWFDGEDLTTTE